MYHHYFKGEYMKKHALGLLFFALSFASLNAMDTEEKTSGLTFVAAQKEENLDQYGEILLREYLKFAESEQQKEFIHTRIKEIFPYLKSYIDNKECIIKVLHDNNPIGFISLGQLNDEATEIVLYVSPIPDEYKQEVCSKQLRDRVKDQYPNTQKLYTACPSHLTKLADFIKATGFQEDSSYKVTQELLPPEGIVGYSLDF